MRSSFHGLEVSKRTIQISQKALDVSTSNMANIMTPGYTRQRLDTHAMYQNTYKNWQTKQSRLSLAGQGVNAYGVAQLRNPYLDKRFREMNSSLAELETKIPVMEEIQTMIDLYENVGMEAMIARFKDALSKYATNAPDNRELANIVRNSAYDITTMLNSYARDMDKMLEDNVFELGETIKYVNTLIDKVAQLNVAIVKEYKATEYGNIYGGNGVSAYGPLELLDQRNLILDELSTYMNIKVEENVDGSVKVWMGDVKMVDNEYFEHIVMHDYKQFNAAVLVASNGQSFNIKGGAIKGYVDLVNGNGPYASHYQSSNYGIPYYRSAIDAFAEAFAELYNSTNGANDPDNPDRDLRLMFGSSLDVYDANGVLIERGPINASTIRIAESWTSANATMIGTAFDEIDTRTMTINLDSFNLGQTYNMNVTIAGIRHMISFVGGATEEDTALAINTAIQAAFGHSTLEIIVNDDGTVENSISSGRVDVNAASVINLTTPPTGTYALNVTIGNITRQVTFNFDPASTTQAQRAAIINTAIRNAFPNIGSTNVVDPVTGVVNGSIASVDIPNTGTLPTGTVVFPSSGLGLTLERSVISKTGPDLDGNHAHRLMLALDESVKYGRALDFVGTPFDYIAFLSNRLGQGLNFMNEQRDTLEVTTNSLLDSRDAISGVSNDEEGINMLIYQKWYNAAARMMTALDECLDRIINGMGRVGL